MNAPSVSSATSSDVRTAGLQQRSTPASNARSPVWRTTEAAGTVGPVSDDTTTDQPEISLYEAVGGDPFFGELVHRFYLGVAADQILAPMYPAEDMEGAKERLMLFLIQFWGGPTTYSDNRGHPRLRMRHAPFSVDRAARDAWLRHMRAAVESLLGHVDGGQPVIDALMGYFERSAEFMRNVEEGDQEPQDESGVASGM